MVANKKEVKKPKKKVVIEESEEVIYEVW